MEDLADLHITDITADEAAAVPHSQNAPNLSASPETSDATDAESGLSSKMWNSAAVHTSTREAVVKYEMARKEDSYTDVHTLRVFCGTWNVNGRSATQSTPLADWLASTNQPPDIYAIGFQELDLSKEAFLFADTPKENEWLSLVLSHLHPGASYVRVRVVRLVGIMLVVLAHARLRAYIRRVAAETVGTGIMGKMGNKGGVAVRLDIYSTSVCFVNSHLAAHVDEYERRNQDYNDICQRLRFSGLSPAGTAIKDHDQVFWLGDLNYRLSNIDVDTAKSLIDLNNFHKLLEHDQLCEQRRLGRVFVGYNEPEVKFRPTYKYDPDSDVWDTSEKARAPAWCDRVLWRGEEVEVLHYTSHMSLQLSDHKPVSALFNAGVKVIDPARYRRIYEHIMKELDRYENDSLPQLVVDSTEVIFGRVHFLELQRRHLFVTNTGQVAVQFRFINKLNDTSYCKNWLSVEPSSAVLMPQEQCELVFEVRVDERCASDLNTCQDKLYDILVLHLENGKDIFITVQGDYVRSCFGASINALVHIKCPFRELSMAKLLDLESATPRDLSPNPYVVPKEIWFLVDQLHRHLITAPEAIEATPPAVASDAASSGAHELFLHAGLASEVRAICRALDTTLPDVLPGGIHSVAEALLLFLSCLRESVVPQDMSAQCLEHYENFNLAKSVVSRLPTNHKNVFSYLCTFLKELADRCSSSSSSHTDAFTLARMFGGVLLRNPGATWRQKNNISPEQLERRRTTFIYHFIVNEIDF